MTLYLLDTDVLSRLARGVDLAIATRVRENDLACRVSAISWFELRYGLARSPSPARWGRRLSLLRELLPDPEVFDSEAAKRAAHVRASLEALRPDAQPIGPYDVLLAGHALAMGAILVTHNTRELARVPGLSVEDWQES